MYTYEELKNYTVRQLKVIADYEGKTYSKRVTKTQLIDLLMQLELPIFNVKSEQDTSPCSVRIQRIRNSK